MKTYFRLLAFAKPIEKFAIPYFIYTVISVVFNTLNLALLIPLLNTLFAKDSTYVRDLEAPNWYNVVEYFNYYAKNN
jgi:subfamily B ATP-binding cassette protein MsbA